MTLVDRVRSLALQEGEEARFFFIDGAARIRDSFSYARLDAVATSIATGLVARGLSGQRVVLLMKPGCEFLYAFIGCLYAGAVPVPVALPGADRSNARLQSIVRSCDPRAIMTDKPELMEAAAVAGIGAPVSLWSDFMPAPGAAAVHLPLVRGEDLAFLQYSSGSTASPKGVMVSHANLADNLQCIVAKHRMTRDSRGLTWLPHFHDMGLIGGLLAPMFVGACCHFMTPMDFAKHPLSWLQAASRFGSTYTGAPDFAFDACATLAEDGRELALDLRSLETCACGAEPICANSIRRFLSAFARHGLRPSSFFPCYGMAECTVMTSSASFGQSGLDLLQTFDSNSLSLDPALPSDTAKREVELVSSGTPVSGHEVIIVDQSCQPCPEGATGEIWIRGPSVAQGYWNDAAQTEATFGARTRDGAGPFLRSGDLGFLHGGKLFVTGRIKDLIIVRGCNIHPQDIEYPAGRCHAQLRPGIAAAFSILDDDGAESLALVQAVRPACDVSAYPEIALRIHAHVLQQQGVRLDVLVLTHARNIPMTTSGKIQRQLCRARFLSGELSPVLDMRWTAGFQAGCCTSSA